MSLQIRRGTDAERLTITPAEGEPVYCTDTKILWVGDGITVGGILPVASSGGGSGGDDPTKVAKAGDTMTGLLTLSGDPVTAYHAATKTYVDSLVGSISLSDPSKVAKTGDIMTGRLTLSADPTTAMHAVTKQYVDSLIVSGGGGDDPTKVAKAGDTMTGFLQLHAMPVDASHAATKEYVDTTISALTFSDDSKVAKAGDTMTGLLTLSGSPVNDLHATTKKYVDDAVAAGGGSGGGGTDPTKVAKAGDTMTGLLTLSGSPIDPLHAATKEYVDAAQGSVAGAHEQIQVNVNGSLGAVDGFTLHEDGVANRTTLYLGNTANSGVMIRNTICTSDVNDALRIAGQNPTIEGSGTHVWVYGGQGKSSNSTAAPVTGGPVHIVGGTGFGEKSIGGAVNISGGDTNGVDQPGGEVQITAGNGSYTGANVHIHGGYTTSNIHYGGDITLRSGSNGDSSQHGDITLDTVDHNIRYTGLGELNIDDDPGVAGQMLMSGGVGGTIAWADIQGAAVAGANTEIQFNDNGTLGTDPGLAFITPNANIGTTSSCLLLGGGSAVKNIIYGGLATDVIPVYSQSPHRMLQILGAPADYNEGSEIRIDGGINTAGGNGGAVTIMGGRSQTPISSNVPLAGGSVYFRGGRCYEPTGTHYGMNGDTNIQGGYDFHGLNGDSAGSGGDVRIDGGYVVNSPIKAGSVYIQAGYHTTDNATYGGSIVLKISGGDALSINNAGAFGLGDVRDFGTPGQVLTSNGPSAIPTWSDMGSGGGSGLAGVTSTQTIGNSRTTVVIGNSQTYYGAYITNGFSPSTGGKLRLAGAPAVTEGNGTSTLVFGGDGASLSSTTPNTDAGWASVYGGKGLGPHCNGGRAYLFGGDVDVDSVDGNGGDVIVRGGHCVDVGGGVGAGTSTGTGGSVLIMGGTSNGSTVGSVKIQGSLGGTNATDGGHIDLALSIPCAQLRLGSYMHISYDGAMSFGAMPNYGSDGQVLTSRGAGLCPTWTTISGGGGGGTVLPILSEGTQLTAAAASINFAGTGVTTTTNGNDVTVTINQSTGGGGGGTTTPGDVINPPGAVGVFPINGNVGWSPASACVVNASQLFVVGYDDNTSNSEGMLITLSGTTFTEETSIATGYQYQTYHNAVRLTDTTVAVACYDDNYGDISCQRLSFDSTTIYPEAAAWTGYGRYVSQNTNISAAALNANNVVVAYVVPHDSLAGYDLEFTKFDVSTASPAVVTTASIGVVDVLASTSFVDVVALTPDLFVTGYTEAYDNVVLVACSFDTSNNFFTTSTQTVYGGNGGDTCKVVKLSDTSVALFVHPSSNGTSAPVLCGTYDIDMGNGTITEVIPLTEIHNASYGWMDAVYLSGGRVLFAHTLDTGATTSGMVVTFGTTIATGSLVALCTGGEPRNNKLSVLSETSVVLTFKPSPTADTDISMCALTIPAPVTSGGSGTSISIQDESTTLTTGATQISFVGAGVTATSTGSAVTVTIPGGGGGGAGNVISPPVITHSTRTWWDAGSQAWSAYDTDIIDAVNVRPKANAQWCRYLRVTAQSFHNLANYHIGSISIYSAYGQYNDLTANATITSQYDTTPQPFNNFLQSAQLWTQTPAAGAWFIVDFGKVELISYWGNMFTSGDHPDAGPEQISVDLSVDGSTWSTQSDSYFDPWTPGYGQGVYYTAQDNQLEQIVTTQPSFVTMRSKSTGKFVTYRANAGYGNWPGWQAGGGSYGGQVPRAANLDDNGQWGYNTNCKFADGIYNVALQFMASGSTTFGTGDFRLGTSVYVGFTQWVSGTITDGTTYYPIMWNVNTQEIMWQNAGVLEPVTQISPIIMDANTKIALAGTYTYY